MKLSLLSEYAWKGTKSYEQLLQLAALLASVANGHLSGKSERVFRALEIVAGGIKTDDGDESEQQRQKLHKQYLLQYAEMARKEENLSPESAADLILIIQKLVKYDHKPI